MTKWEDEEGVKLKLSSKLYQLNFGLVLLVTIGCACGFAMLYSAAGGNLQPWAQTHAERYVVGIIWLIFLAVVDIRIFFK